MTEVQRYMDRLNPGDTVNILDTSNDRLREGAVRRVLGTAGQPMGLEVYVYRFKRVFKFDKDGLTSLGRFKVKVP